MNNKQHNGNVKRQQSLTDTHEMSIAKQCSTH